MSKPDHKRNSRLEKFKESLVVAENNTKKLKGNVNAVKGLSKKDKAIFDKAKLKAWKLFQQKLENAEKTLNSKAPNNYKTQSVDANNTKEAQEKLLAAKKSVLEFDKKLKTKYAKTLTPKQLKEKRVQNAIKYKNLSEVSKVPAQTELNSKRLASLQNAKVKAQAISASMSAVEKAKDFYVDTLKNPKAAVKEYRNKHSKMSKVKSAVKSFQRMLGRLTKDSNVQKQGNQHATPPVASQVQRSGKNKPRAGRS